MILFIFFNDTATTEIYTLSLHDALPISGISNLQRPSRRRVSRRAKRRPAEGERHHFYGRRDALDRKSTRLNSSHANISYAVLCLKKKNRNNTRLQSTTTKKTTYLHSTNT